MKKVTSTSDYFSLLSRIKTVLIEGQRRIEAERIFTYWETGRIILAYILQHKDRADYGAQVLKRLAKDLDMDISTLKRCVQFARIYPQLPKGAGGRQFKWTHYRQLITVPDDKKRLSWEKAVIEKDWTAEELGERLKEDPSRRGPPLSLPSPKPKVESRELIAPLRGTPYTYQVIERPSVNGGQPQLRLDLGFGVFLKADSRQLSAFSKGTIIESRPFQGDFKLYKTTRTAKDLYTYWAEVEKIIDADTLKVRFDLGFNIEVRETLRLRGIDCPELESTENIENTSDKTQLIPRAASQRVGSSTKYPGRAAKAFVQSYIKEADTILVRSSRSDKYDRYLADIFIKAREREIYLNNLLLEKGHAIRWE